MTNLQLDQRQNYQVRLETNLNIPIFFKHFQFQESCNYGKENYSFRFRQKELESCQVERKYITLNDDKRTETAKQSLCKMWKQHMLSEHNIYFERGYEFEDFITSSYFHVQNQSRKFYREILDFSSFVTNMSETI